MAYDFCPVKLWRTSSRRGLYTVKYKPFYFCVNEFFASGIKLQNSIGLPVRREMLPEYVVYSLRMLTGPEFPGSRKFFPFPGKKIPEREFSGNQCVLHTRYGSVINCRVT